MKCKQPRADGSPCKSPFVDPATGLCAAHGPGGRAKMRERGRRGAEATQRKNRGRGVVKPGEAPEPPQTIEDARLIAAWAVRACLTGEIDTRVAQQTAALLREFRSSVKESAMEAEVAELRTQVAKLREKRGKG